MKNFTTLFLIVLFNNNSLAQNLNIDITQIDEQVYLHTSYNMFGDILYGSNGMYVVTEKGVILFDTPWGEDQTARLIDSIQTRHQKDIIFCIVSHFHDDRNGGLDILNNLGVPTWSTKLTDSLALSIENKRASNLMENDTSFIVGEEEIEVFFPGEGHTIDNIVFWLPKQQILFGGCLLKSLDASGKGNLADANVNQWPASVEKLRNEFPNPKIIVPGHQTIGDNRIYQHTFDLISN